MREEALRRDEAYRLLIEAHRGLTDEESADLDARLVLVLAEALGDNARLREAIALAREGFESPRTDAVSGPNPGESRDPETRRS